MSCLPFYFAGEMVQPDPVGQLAIQYATQGVAKQRGAI
jgi:hypothetical protein